MKRIIVCIKQVPDTAKVEIDPNTHTIRRLAQGAIINPYDLHAIEAAVMLKEALGLTVTVISMGPPSAENMIKDTFALGVDEGYLLTDKAFAGSDTLSTSRILSFAIKRFDDIALIITGLQAIDGDTAQVGSELAALLKIPNALYVNNIINADISDLCPFVIAERLYEDGILRFKLSLPALLSVTRECNKPRTPSIHARLAAKKKNVVLWSAQDIAIDRETIGLNGSPTKVIKTEAMSSERKCRIIDMNAADAASLIANLMLKEWNAL